jgi:murein DD-endopeptidase MepM/ murein hydrolase activator NlpD
MVAMNFEAFLKQNLSVCASMFEPSLTSSNCVTMDLSSSSQEFAGLGEGELDRAILHKIAAADAIAGVGGYLENRSLYKDTELFQGDSERCIHIGVDVFMPAGAVIHAPFDARVQSFANRQVTSDYGPVIILRHEIDGFEFHSLYGHLAEASLDGLICGKEFSAGEPVAKIGARPVNGNWPPHLHFQLIRDMQGCYGDYPGVVRPADLEFFKANCPDPTALLLAQG